MPDLPINTDAATVLESIINPSGTAWHTTSSSARVPLDLT
jgi:hypothetical protein